MGSILEQIVLAHKRLPKVLLSIITSPWGLLIIFLQIFFSLCLAAYVHFFLLYPPRKYDPNAPGNKRVSVQVLVLGDIGRSPRMQYHALSIAKQGGTVQIIGYRESALVPELENHENVETIPLRAAFGKQSKLPFIIAGPVKVVYQTLQLLYILLYVTKPAKWLLIQNPPSIPTMAVSAWSARLRSTGLIIDWHNFGWTILAGTRGSKHPFVYLSKQYERLTGRLADANLCVTAAMKATLQRAPYNITAPIFAMHDRPAAIFQPMTDQAERKTFLRNLAQTSMFAENIIAGKVRLLVSSTSWTPDEDFGILLDALVHYAVQVTHVPLLVVITGRGPQKAMYCAKMRRLQAEGRLDNINIITAFLSFEDYAKLLAAADLGVCLHKSSSGVDLPMKVVDMFGAGLPVVAYSEYSSFSELVQVGVNGSGFETSDQLMSGLNRLLDPNSNELAKLKEGAMKEGTRRWDEEWNEVVKPLLGFS